MVTKWYADHYQQQSIIVNRLPATFATSPHPVIYDSMFWLNTSPLSSYTTFEAYANFLFSRWVKGPFEKNATSVHMVFDDSSVDIVSPKSILRQVRDSSTQHEDFAQEHAKPICDQDPVPKNWKRFLSCRPCKRRLVEFISMASLRLVRRTFTCHEQQFVTSGGFSGNLAGKTLGIIAGRAELFEFPYGSNADEGDSRVWRHTLRHQQAMVYSPDTDTFHIGLPLVCSQSVFVQLDMPGSRERSYISLNALQSSFMADPDLQCVPANKKCLTLQVSFIATGCDYVSFFCCIGKTFFMNTLVKNAEFITGGSSDDVVPGMLCATLRMSMAPWRSSA